MRQTRKDNEWHFGMKAHAGGAQREQMPGKAVKWHVAAKRSKGKAMRDGALKELVKQLERAKARIRARVDICSIIARFATKAWPGIRHSYSACSVWRIWCLPKSSCWRHREAIRPEREDRARKGAKWGPAA